MSGDKKSEPDRGSAGWRDYARTENVGERDGDDDLEETEEQVPQGQGAADADGDGKPDPPVGSSDFLSRDVKTELEKDRLKGEG